MDVVTIIGNVEHMYKNVRYKLLQVDDTYYLLDMDRLAWSIVFPFIYWFVPHPVYQIDKATYESLKIPDEQRGGRIWGVLAIAGISVPLGRLIGSISDQYIDAMPYVFMMIMFIVFIDISICIRLFVHCSSNRKMNNRIRLDTMPKRNIKIRPTIIGFFKAFLLYFSFLGISIFAGFLYVELKDFLAGVCFAWLVTFSLLSNTFIIPPGSVKVTYLKDDN